MNELMELNQMKLV